MYIVNVSAGAYSDQFVVSTDDPNKALNVGLKKYQKESAFVSAHPDISLRHIIEEK